MHPPLEGVLVELWEKVGEDAGGNDIYSFTGQVEFTDENGDYWFTDLLPGTYAVREFTPVDDRNIKDGDSRVGTAGGSQTGNDIPDGYDEISGITLTSGQIGENYDFCEHLPIEISGYVYHDANDNGVFEKTDEDAIQGVTINLFRSVTDPGGTTEVLIDSTTTDIDGFYQFTDLPLTISGSPLAFHELIVREVQPGASSQAPDGWIDGQDTPGTGMFVNGAAVNNDELSGILAGFGDKGVEFNFGELLPVSISGTVYHDRMNDGDRDPGDEGLGGSVIEIIRVDTPTEQLVRTLVTEPDGTYEARGLAPGKYRVQQVTQPFTDLGVEYRDGIDNAGYVDIDPGPGETRDPRGTATNPGDEIGVIMLMQGEDSVENNFGEYLPASIRGKVYLSDEDHNCEIPDGFDLGDRALAGVIIELYNGDHTDPANLVDVTVTGPDGSYEFLDLDPGEYTIVEITPGDLLDGDEHVGSHGGIVLDADNPNSVISDIHLVSGDDGVEYDFCEHKPAKIGGFVYHDRDNDGQKETGEEGIAQVLVTLFDADGNVVDTTFTDSDGMYMFGNLKVGEYKIQEGDPGPQWIDGIDTIGEINIDGDPTNQKLGEGVSEELDMLHTINLKAGDVGVNYNFGEYLPSSLEGFVFVHPQGNCELPFDGQPDDPLQGITVELIDVSTGLVIATDVTDSDGRYRFENLAPASTPSARFTTTTTSKGARSPASSPASTTRPCKRAAATTAAPT